MNEEQLFRAVGAADPALLERSSRHAVPAVKWGLLAACLALLCTAALMTYHFSAAPPDDANVSDVLTFTGEAVGVLHLEALCYETEKTENFFLYVNEDRYYGVWEDGSYVIRPITPVPEGLPVCDLTISHWQNTSLNEAEELIYAKLAETYSMVLPSEDQTDRASVSAYNGTEFGAEWDAASARVTVIDDQEGGVFTLTARFFTEAAEGLGADFAGMSDSFQPVPAGLIVPDWLKSLRETLDILLSAVFSYDWSAARNLLTDDARIFGYREDVSDQVSVSAIDISPDDGAVPTAAVVSVRHRLSAEEPYNDLIIELRRTDGQWKAQLIELKR